MRKAPMAELPKAARMPRYTEEDRRSIVGADANPYRELLLSFVWRRSEVHYGVRVSDRLVAHCGLVTATVRVGRSTEEVVGFSELVVAPDFRDRGIASLAAIAAEEHARTMGPQFGLLFSWPDIVPRFEKYGWHAIDNDTRAGQPDDTALPTLRPMWKPLRDGAKWPVGPVRLLSMPM